MDEKYIQDLFDQLGGEKKFGKFDDFKHLMGNDSTYRKDFYDAFGEKQLGAYQDFDALVKKKDTSNNVATPSEDGLSGTPKVEAATTEEIPVVSLEDNQPDAFELAKQHNDLKNKTIEGVIGGSSFAMGSTSSLPDENSKKKADNLAEFMKVNRGVEDPEQLYEETKDLTPNDFGRKGFSKEELIADRQENPNVYQRKLGRLKWQSGLEKNLSESLIDGSIDKATYDGINGAIQSSLNSVDVGDYTQQRQNINTIANAIKTYGGADKEKLLSNYAIEVGKIYGNAYKNPPKEDAPESKFLSQNATLAYQYLKDVAPEKAGQYERLFIDPKSLKEGSDEKAGYDHLMLNLEENGIQLQQNAVNEDLNNLSKIAKRDGGLSPEQISQAEALQTKSDELTKQQQELETKYPEKRMDKVDDAVTEILGSRLNYAQYALGKGGQAIKNTAQGVWEAVSTPFMDDESNKMRELAIMGESMGEEKTYQRPDATKALINDKLIIQPELQKQIDEIVNDKSIEGDKKRLKLYTLLMQNTDKFSRVPIKGGKIDINPTSILYGVTDIATSLMPFVAIEAATGGIGGAGTGARLLRTFTAAAATTFHDEYANAIKEGLPQSQAYKQAMGITAINSAAMAGAGTAGKVREMIGGKTSAGEILKGMSDEAIEAVLAKGTPRGLKAVAAVVKDRVKATPKMLAGGVRAGAEFEVTMTAANELKHSLYNTPIDREQNFKQSLINIANFKVMGLLGHVGYKSPTEMQKSAIHEFGSKPEQFLAEAEKMKANGDLTPAEFEHRKDLIERSSEALKTLPRSVAKGRELTQKEQADYLYNTVIKNEAKKAKSTLPKKQAAEAEHTEMVADAKNDIILASPTDKQLEAQQASLEKKLEPKAEGETPIPEKEKAEIKAELDAVKETIEERKAIVVEPPMQVPEPKTVESKEEPVSDVSSEVVKSNFEGIESFETSNGSVYTVLPDGRTQRFKTKTNEQKEPQDLTVFVKFKGQQEDNFLEAVQNSSNGEKVYVIDENGKVVRKNSDIKGRIALVIADKNGKAIESIEVSATPREGYNTYDQRQFEKNGETFTERHIGNTVSKINKKAIEQPQPTAQENKQLNKDTPTVSSEVEPNWNYEGEGDALSGKDGQLAYTQRLLPDWNRERQKGNINTSSKITYDIVRGRFGGQDNKEVVEAKDENGVVIGVIKKSSNGGIEHLVVAPEFRNKGVATELYNRLKNENKSVDLSKTKQRSKDFAAWANKLKQENKPIQKEPNKQTTSETNEPVKPEEVKPSKAEPIENISGAEPPKKEEKVSTGIFSEPKRTEFSHRGLQEVATEFGLNDITSRERVSDLQLFKGADETIAKWTKEGTYKKNVDDLIEKAKAGDIFSPEQNVIMAQHIAQMREKATQAREKFGINSPEYNEQLKQLQSITTIGQKVRSDIGAALRVPNISRTYMATLEDAMTAKMDAVSTDALTEKQKAEVEKQFETIKKERDDYEAKWKEAQAKFTEMQAQNELSKTSSKVAKKTTGGKRDFKAERQSLKDKLKQQVEEYKAAGQKMGVSSDGGAESFIISAKIAKTITEISKSHVEEVGAKIKEVTKRTLEDVKEYIGDKITENDIMDVLAGKYNEKRKTRSQLAADMREVQTESKLLQEYQRLLEGGEPNSEKRRIERNQRLAELRKEIKGIEELGKEVEGSKDAALQAKIDKNKEVIAELDKLEKEDKVKADKERKLAQEKSRKEVAEFQAAFDKKQREAEAKKKQDAADLEKELRRQANEKARIEKEEKDAKLREEKLAKLQKEKEDKQLEREVEKEQREAEKARLKAQLDAAKELQRQLNYKTPAERIAAEAIARNKRAEAKIRERIANGDFEPKKKPESFMESTEFKERHPDLYKQVLDSQVKKEEAQIQFDTDLVADEMRRASTADKWRDIWRKSVGTVKQFFASFDFSGLGIQNLPMIVTNPVIGAKGIKESLSDFASQKRHDRYLAELHNSPDWPMIKEVIRISEPKSLSEKNKEQLFPDRFKAIVKIKGKTYGYVKIGGGKYELFDISKPFERQFVSLGNSLRVIKLRTEADKLYEKGYTWEKNPEEFIALGKRINNLTSAPEVPQQYQNDLTNTFIWSTRLIAAKLNMLGISDIAAFIPKSGVKKGYYKSLGVKGKILSRQQLYAAADLAKFASAVMATTYLAAMAGGGEVNTDPNDDGFLDVTFKDGISKNYTGGFSKYIALVSQLIRQGKSKNGQFEPYTGLKDRVQQVTHFLAGKQPPITRAVTSIIGGKDYTGKETDLGAEASKLKYPMAVGQIAEQIKKDGLEGLFEQGIETIIGVNVKDQRDYQNSNSGSGSSRPHRPQREKREKRER